MHGETVKLIQK